MFALRLRDWDSIEVMLSRLPARSRFCLDGIAAHPEGRWTFLGACPEQTLRVSFGTEAPLAALGALDGGGAQEALRGDPVGLEPDEIPHWVGFTSYDAAWSDPSALGLRARPRLPRSSSTVVWFGRYETLIAVDQVRGAAWALAADAEGCRALAERVSTRLPADGKRDVIIGPVRVEAPSRHRARIEKALSAISAGDLYQVNLARVWRASYSGSPKALWSAMRAASPVPLGAYLELPEAAIVCRTMERFVRWSRRERRLWTSPIKGTLARSGSDDAAEAQTLQADPKERAEHSMIVDLMRNDLSRVAVTGSVRVLEPLRVEAFAGLSHLVSTVECTTPADIGMVDVLEATFPPGSVTGTPKLAAMELIEREEDAARGVYTGALGYVDRGGGLSLAVAIRTATVSDGQVSYFAGGGLVSASDPDREIAETELKAKVFLDALGSIRDEKKD